MAENNHEFVIKVAGKLSPEASQRIQKSINQMLASELANGAFADDDGNICGTYIPHKWIGRQILVASNIAQLEAEGAKIGNLSFIAPTRVANEMR
jgi:hypothetical protein